MVQTFIDSLKDRDTDIVSSEELHTAEAGYFPIDKEVPDNTATATFALGCFWGSEAVFGVVPGVVRTRVGYAGGEKKDPTYHDFGDHTETVQIDYHPAEVTYQDLLDIFWEGHNPRKQMKTQYKSIIFVHNEKQQRLAEKVKEEHAEKNERIYTDLQEFSHLYLAENYHQKYHLREHSAIFEEFDEVYSPAQIINSTAAARVNGYLSRHGIREQFEKEKDRFGLSDETMKKLRKMVYG